MIWLLISLGAFLLLLGGYLAVTSRSKARWLGALSILAAAPFFVWAGAFTNQFRSGICYSEVVDHIASAVEHTTDPTALASAIRALPMEGYETSCERVEQQSAKLPNAIASGER
jgi:hypothetical protein